MLSRKQHRRVLARAIRRWARAGHWQEPLRTHTGRALTIGGAVRLRRGSCLWRFLFSGVARVPPILTVRYTEATK